MLTRTDLFGSVPLLKFKRTFITRVPTIATRHQGSLLLITSQQPLASAPKAAVALIVTEIKVRAGEPIDRAIRRLKKKLDREHTLQQFRLRRRFEKPSARRRRKEKAARFEAMLKARHAQD